MKTISSPTGRAYLSIISTSIDPARRFTVKVSDNYQAGLDGLTEMAKEINAFVKEVRAAEKAAEKAAAKAEEGGDE